MRQVFCKSHLLHSPLGMADDFLETSKIESETRYSVRDIPDENASKM